MGPEIKATLADPEARDIGMGVWESPVITFDRVPVIKSGQIDDLEWRESVWAALGMELGNEPRPLRALFDASEQDALKSYSGLIERCCIREQLVAECWGYADCVEF